MAEETIFSRILAGTAPADVVYEDELCLAFRDINPQAPQHILLIPRTPIAKLSDSLPEHQALLGHLMLVAGDIARQQGFADGFRLIANNGATAGQTVMHLHFHLMAGRPMPWPPS